MFGEAPAHRITRSYTSEKVVYCLLAYFTPILASVYLRHFTEMACCVAEDCICNRDLAVCIYGDGALCHFLTYIYYLP